MNNKPAEKEGGKVVSFTILTKFKIPRTHTEDVRYPAMKITKEIKEHNKLWKACPCLWIGIISWGYPL